MKYYKDPILINFYSHLKYYPTPVTLTYFWGFGSLAGISLVIQIITGVLLAMHYSPNAEYAFSSIEHIMRDVNQGWFIRYVHSNGASMFFIVIYLHICRGLYYKSFRYTLKEVWLSGMTIFILMMATAFIGYVLPWGQMSYWGATVITNIFSAIPLVGNDFVYWLWGGFSVGDPTLNRFFSLHYLLPFIMITIIFVHLIYLHEVGSSNSFPLSFRLLNESIFFYPYFILKDLLGLFIFFFIFAFFVGFIPDFLGHSDNYNYANVKVTPEHIVPEWYFLPFYAILRSIPDKLGGILYMFSAIIILFVMPYLENLKMFYINQLQIKLSVDLNILLLYLYQLFVFLFICCFIVLGWLGSQPAEYPFITCGYYLTFIYFVLLIFMILLN